jgi:hypothetical protein
MEVDIQNYLKQEANKVEQKGLRLATLACWTFQASWKAGQGIDFLTGHRVLTLRVTGGSEENVTLNKNSDETVDERKVDECRHTELNVTTKNFARR